MNAKLLSAALACGLSLSVAAIAQTAQSGPVQTPAADRNSSDSGRAATSSAAGSNSNTGVAIPTGAGLGESSVSTTNDTGATTVRRQPQQNQQYYILRPRTNEVTIGSGTGTPIK